MPGPTHGARRVVGRAGRRATPHGPGREGGGVGGGVGPRHIPRSPRVGGRVRTRGGGEGGEGGEGEERDTLGLAPQHLLVKLVG